MSEPLPLPPLRRALDLMPSPLPERPGLLLRDPFRYTEVVAVIPPPLVPLLALFDGRHDIGDLKTALVRQSGDVLAVGLASQLVETLGRNGFLEDETFRGLRDAREQAFAAAPSREAVHAGSAYPAEEAALRSTLAGYLGAEQAAPGEERLVGVAAPHVSPEGGVPSYRAAYRALGAQHAERTFVVLGTSHYGAPDCFGLTRKPYVTPLGQTRTDPEIVETLAGAAGAKVAMEDYCHAVEHSIEFQVVFLQHLYGPRVKVVPVLCGPFATGMKGGWPEEHDGVAGFLGALARLDGSGDERPLFVLGVDMSHIGRRYGDRESARADAGALVEVARRDRERIERVEAGDARGFWELVREEGDPLRWCGASPLYSFLKTRPARGRLLCYEQWNIDPDSVVSFAGMAFEEGARATAGK